MTSTGIVRKVDELGRIVIPKETREMLSIKEKDALEVFVDEGSSKKAIILKKYNPGCVFCGQVENTFNFEGTLVCRDCVKEMKKKA